jgi:hypothetical protein
LQSHTWAHSRCFNFKNVNKLNTMSIITLGMNHIGESLNWFGFLDNFTGLDPGRIVVCESSFPTEELFTRITSAGDRNKWNEGHEATERNFCAFVHTAPEEYHKCRLESHELIHINFKYQRGFKCNRKTNLLSLCRHVLAFTARHPFSELHE